jgi:predicted transcriptional regulator
MQSNEKEGYCTSKIEVRISPQLKDILDKYASVHKLSMSFVVRQAIEDLLNIQHASIVKSPHGLQKYKTKEEAKAAKQKSDRARYLLVKQLLEEDKKRRE